MKKPQSLISRNPCEELDKICYEQGHRVQRQEQIKSHGAGLSKQKSIKREWHKPTRVFINLAGRHME